MISVLTRNSSRQNASRIHNWNHTRTRETRRTRYAKKMPRRRPPRLARTRVLRISRQNYQSWFAILYKFLLATSSIYQALLQPHSNILALILFSIGEDCPSLKQMQVDNIWWNGMLTKKKNTQSVALFFVDSLKKKKTTTMWQCYGIFGE